MGMLMVIGIAVSNGILLVDDANRGLRAGATPIDAIVDAARVRFMPIAMTSLATVIGLVPTALGLDAASASNRPLALAVVGGLLSSTVLSLFLVPTMFTLLARRPTSRPRGGRARAHRRLRLAVQPREARAAMTLPAPRGATVRSELARVPPLPAPPARSREANAQRRRRSRRERRQRRHAGDASPRRTRPGCPLIGTCRTTALAWARPSRV